MKVRIWDKRKKVMMDDLDLCGDISINAILENPGHVFMVFLGFNDKKGKEVFEGDIIKCWSGQGELLYGGEAITLGKWTLHNNSNLIEIIGNKWENPELNKHENAI